MLGERIQQYRKQKGYTQEDLANRIHVVRQTVSKWEKNLSVPDAEQLSELSDILEIPVSTLLGGKTEEKTEQNQDAIATQLMRLNEELAIQNKRRRRIWKVIGILAAFMILSWVLMIASAIIFKVDHNSHSTQESIQDYEQEME